MSTKKKNRLPYFVPMLKSTMATPAWRQMSHGAQALYIALKSQMSSDHSNNGRVFLSQRDAKRQIRSGFRPVTKWFREIQHYGFTVRTKGGGLGVNGKGTSPHWRLTECPCNGKPPTNDFLRWNGETFKAANRHPKKQNPAGKKHSTLLAKSTAVPLAKSTAGPKKSQQNPAGKKHSISRKRYASPDLASFPPSDAETKTEPGPDGRLPWSTPTLVEVTDPAEIAAIRAACDEDQP